MKFEIVRGRELGAEQFAQWAECQKADSVLGSPYFRPEFTRAIASVREDVFVAVIDRGAAFFPFQRGPWKLGCPVGGVLSDYHGVVAPPEFSIDAVELVRRCGLRAWDFDHIPAAQENFERHAPGRSHSPILDLTRADAGGSMKLRDQTARNRRKLEREWGAVKFEMHNAAPAVLRQLFAWKSAQFARTGVPDLFASSWIRDALTAIHAQQSEEFSGVLSLLRAGDRLVAAHFGMRSRSVFHYWFPAYDAELGSFSPGMMLLLELIDAARAHGVQMIDFGKGDAPYKQRLANDSIALLEGSVVAAGWLRTFRRQRAAAEAWIREGRLNQPARFLARTARRKAGAS